MTGFKHSLTGASRPQPRSPPEVIGFFSTHKEGLEYIIARIQSRTAGSTSDRLAQLLSGRRFGIESVQEYTPTLTQGYVLHVLKTTGGLAGHAIEKVVPGTDAFGKSVINIPFTAQGGKDFYELTRNNVNEALAIVLDEDVISAPVIQEGIPGGRVQLSLGAIATPSELEDVAAALNTGALPGHSRQVSAREVQPTTPPRQ